MSHALNPSQLVTATARHANRERGGVEQHPDHGPSRVDEAVPSRSHTRKKQVQLNAGAVFDGWY